MAISNKYRPLILVFIFTSVGLVISLLLSILRLFIEGQFINPISGGLIFVACVAILLGIIYCEISARIKSKIWGAIIFGFMSSQLFIACLILSSIVGDGVVKEMPENMYLVFTSLFTPMLAGIYFGTVAKNT